MRFAIPALAFFLIASAFASPSPAQGPAPANPPASVADLLRYEPTGLTLLSPYERGAESEKLVATGHLCLDHPEVIGEVRRILDAAGQP